MESKTCPTCEHIKPFSEFYKCKRRKDKLTKECKECVKHRSKLNVKKNEESIKEYRKDYRTKNKKNLAEYQKNHYKNNRDTYREKSKKYRELNEKKIAKQKKRWVDNNRDRINDNHRRYMEDPKNRERKNKANRRYSKRNPEKILANVNRRRAKKLQATPDWADHCKIDLIYKKAKELEKLTGLKYEVDHIVPLVSDKVCGLHVWENLQILESSLNRKKGNKHD